MTISNPAAQGVAPRQLLDVRPVIPRSPDGLFVRIEQIRDQLHAIATEALSRRGLLGNVLRSHPLVHPCWISIELWEPTDGDVMLTQRSSASATIHAKPYHRFDVEYEVEIDFRGHKKKKVDSLGSFGAAEIEKMISCLLGECAVPTFSRVRLRRHPWELWKKKNKPDALARDWLGALPAVLLLIGALTLAANGVGVIFLVLGGIAGWLLSRRTKVVRTSGKPIGEPRFLLALDSWQTVVFGLGQYGAEVRTRVMDRFKSPFSHLMRWRPERIWYWGLDGVTEREQIVLAMGRAIVFVHFHRYENDLYVAWDGHLNRGQWVEKDVFQGIDKLSGRLAVIRVVVPGIQQLNEYDLSDANGLVEWVHAQVVQVVRQMMTERKIDQEIDFKVIRGERQSITANQEQAAGGGIGAQLKRKLKRVS